MNAHNAHARPFLGAIAVISLAVVGDWPSNAAAQGPPDTAKPAEQFAASRDEVGVPVAPAVPLPAPLPAPTGAPLGGWVPFSLSAPGWAPRFMPAAASFGLAPVGFFAPTYREAMIAQRRPLSLEPNYGNFLDRQTPLPRLDNAAFDRPLSALVPAVSPFGLTDIATYGPLYIGGDARGDAVAGSAQLSSPTSFIPSSIPVQGQPKFGLPQPAAVETGSTIGSRLFLESYVTTEVVPPVRVFSQLTGSVQSNGSGGGQMPHLFGQLKSLTVGKADTFFSDPRAFPNTIDYAGPNALVYLQHKLIGYLFDLHQWPGAALEAGLSVEQPEPSVTPPDPKNASKYTNRSQIPDIAARARLWDPIWGHVQFASILRSVGIENQAYTTGSGATEVEHIASNQQVIGWGVQCTGRLHPFDGVAWVAADLMGFGGSYGRGISSYNPDLGPNSGLDAVFDDKDQLRALPLSCFFMSYTHLWTEQLRSTVVYSQVDLKSFDSPDLTSSPYRRGRYFATNLIYEFDITTAGDNPKKGTAFTGIEYLYGRKELLDGKYGDAHRVQFTAGARY